MNTFWSSSEERRITHGPSFMGEDLLRGRNSLSRTMENEKTRGKWKIVRGNIGVVTYGSKILYAEFLKRRCGS